MLIGNNSFQEFDVGFKQKVNLSLPLSIQIEITESCNLKCPFCYNNSGLVKKTNLPMEKWKRFLLDLMELGGVFQCAFSGGEPLLYKNEIFELMDMLHNDHTGLMLITNGYYLDKCFIERIQNFNWYWIQISIDSYNSTIHDQLRGITGSFDKAVAAVKLLKKYGLPVAISSVICSLNIMNIVGIVKLAFELGVELVLFSPVLPIGRTASNTQLQLDSSQKELYNETINYLTAEYSSKLLIRSALPYEEQLSTIGLAPPFGLLVRPNGDVKIDCLSQKVIGNVFKTHIGDLWKQIIKEERWKNERE